MDALYAAWLAAPHKTATLRAVTEHFRDQLPSNTCLGKPCRKHGHTWNGTPWNLRSHGKCAICEAERIKLRNELDRTDPERKARHRTRCRAYEQRNREQINAKRRERLQECPELRQRKIKGQRRRRERLIAQGLSSRDRTPRKRTLATPVQRAICSAGRCPTVAHLVDAEQRRYWREHPEEHKAHRAQRTRELWRWKYMTNPDLRRYNHEKARRRKALERGNHVVRVTSAQIRGRFQQFDHCCAYCGTASSQLQTEHFLPISKGGTHVLSNILPACQPCNYSKSARNPESWYRSQPFFTEQRWRAILRILGKHHMPIGQLSLI